MRNSVSPSLLAAGVVLLLAVRLSSCQLIPVLPETSGAVSSDSSTTLDTSSDDLPLTSPDLSSHAGNTAENSLPNDSTGEPPAEYTTLPALSGNNASRGWCFIAADPPGQDLPTAIPADAANLISRYDVIWQAPSADRRVVYLTIDQGYEYNDNTARILDVAKLKGVPLTFFVIGSYLEKNPDLVIRMLEEGHLVANHSFTHPDTVNLLADEGPEAVLADIRHLEDAYHDLTGETMARCYRPPSGTYSEQLLDLMTREGYQTVFWSFAYQDWLTDDQPDPAAARERILGQLHDGSIILLHAVSDTNTGLFSELVDAIRARGYEFGRIDEIEIDNR